MTAAAVASHNGNEWGLAIDFMHLYGADRARMYCMRIEARNELHQRRGLFMLRALLCLTPVGWAWGLYTDDALLAVVWTFLGLHNYRGQQNCQRFIRESLGRQRGLLSEHQEDFEEVFIRRNLPCLEIIQGRATTTI